MRLVVTAQVFDDLAEGTPVIWGYNHEEQIPQELADVDFGAVILRRERDFTEEEKTIMTEVERRNSGLLLEEMIKRLEEARDSIKEQAAAGLPRRGDGNVGA